MLGELVADQGCAVQTGQGDELPAVSELAETLDVGHLLVAGHGGFPVEGWGEVVCESLLRVDSVDHPLKIVSTAVGELLLGPDGIDTPFSELLGLLIIGKLALHPDQSAYGA